MDLGQQALLKPRLNSYLLNPLVVSGSSEGLADHMSGEETERSPEESTTEMVQIILPNDTNALGNALGGRVMHWIDLVGAMVAYRHSRRPVVTVAMERLEFIHPIKLGHIVILKARLNYVGNSSMEVGVQVFSEDPRLGIYQLSSHALITYVALDDNGKPMPVPKLRLTTEEDHRLFQEAAARRQQRFREHGK
ncbi:MAG: acyl-CoA thioesterase [Nitrospira sp.]|nr:acyl-CoA thioesterase [Nitrospira sp.]